MSDLTSRVPLQLQSLLQQTQLMRNEICCKLRELNENLTGGSSSGATITPGLVSLTGGASFGSLGGNYRSIDISVISVGTGAVSLTTPSGTVDISHAGLSVGWSIDKASDLYLDPISVTATSNAVVIVAYTKVI